MPASRNHSRRYLHPLLSFFSFLSVLMLSTSWASAQETSTKPASPPAISLAMLDAELQAAIKSAPPASKWPSQNFVKLLDLGDITVLPDGTLIRRYRVAEKLFSERARSEAEVKLNYNAHYETIKVLHARTIQPNGSVKEVDPADMRVTTPHSDEPLYDDGRSVGFSLPGIEDNSVIDYEWETTTKPRLPGQFSDTWTFNGLYPVLHSRYALHAPADKPLNYQVAHEETWKPTIVTSPDGKIKTYTWERSDIPPYADEPGMPPYYQISTWLRVSNMTSWQEYAAWFWQLQHPNAVANDAIRAKALELIAGKKTDEEKARAIYDWVANHVRYVGLEFGLSAIQPHAASVAFDKLYGDCKDKATLLITMLDAVGIKAYPVLLSADDNRPVHAFLPSLDWFDHCIAVADVDNKEVWLDATAEYCAYGDIPPADRGVDALVIREGVGKFEIVPPYKPEQNSVTLRGKMVRQPDGAREGRVEIIALGSAAQAFRGSFRQMTPQQRKDFASSLLHDPDGNAITLKECVLPDVNDKTDPFSLKVTAASSGDKDEATITYDTDFSMNFSNEPALTAETRIQPIVVAPQQWHVEMAFEIPKGYRLAGQAADREVNGPLHRYKRMIVPAKDGKSVTLFITYTTQGGLIPPGDYAKLKAFHKTLDGMKDDEIVLLRNNIKTVGGKRNKK
ncbi:MAG TPA: DUF3857 domain-containing protein [Chthonomonadaceae bacterium]|nr:DUF3857 domain-containing protein [Chthonomonadaceae bacterium]